ncbi:MAG TPA: ImmA/IrrE family metallo-endopeptidase [Xanthobacteraceae bacterium]|nr:ImmA/IrrE family metallo-endopeptidase [Xanthobacteraceae bacterium]
MTVTPAERILMSLGITDPKEIDLEAIAWSRGALVEYRPLDRCDATIVGTSRRAVISVNSRSSPERRRFSIGHELGHWHHDRGRLLFCGDKDVDNPADDALNPERNADAFASDLILPNYLLKPRLRRVKRVTLAAVREIREEYAASLTATLIKIVQSNQFPLVVVCHTQKRRRWFKRADMVPRWWFPIDQLDRATFAADMLFNGAAEQTFPRKMGADAWFDFRNCDRHEILEQSFMLPGPEVLTVLTIPEDGLG